MDFLVDAFDPVVRARMIGEELHRPAARVLGLELLEELRHGARVVPGIVENLRAHDVGLSFGRPRVLQQNGIDGEAGAQLRERALGGVVADHTAQDREGQLRGRRLAGLVRAVAQGHV